MESKIPAFTIGEVVVDVTGRLGDTTSMGMASEPCRAVQNSKAFSTNRKPRPVPLRKRWPHLLFVVHFEKRAPDKAYSLRHSHAHYHSRHIFGDPSRGGFDVQRRYPAFPCCAVGCEDRYHAGRRPRSKIVVLSNGVSPSPWRSLAREHLSGAKDSSCSACPRTCHGLCFGPISSALRCWPRPLPLLAVHLCAWSGLPFGIMMSLFVAMVHIQRVLANPKDRLYGDRPLAKCHSRWSPGFLPQSRCASKTNRRPFNVSRVLIAIAAIFFGVEHFLHPAGCPESCLEKLMPAYAGALAWLSDGRNSSGCRGVFT